jgi:two-component system OmpR family response regulator
MTRVLIVDDDAHIREVVRFALESAGMDTVEAADGPEAVRCFSDRPCDLVVLDVMLPGMDGTDVCRVIRQDSPAPIIFLSARDDEIDRIIGLEIGGDDYLTKPFSPRELVARVRAVLRRIESAPEPAKQHNLSHGRLHLDLARCEASWDAHRVVLTATELGLLRTLIAHPGNVYSREELMTGGYDYQRVVSDRTIDSHVRRVRGKFAEFDAHPIETVHGIGYRLGAC